MKKAFHSKFKVSAAVLFAAVCIGGMLVSGCASSGGAGEKSSVTATVASAQEVAAGDSAVVSSDTVIVSSRGSVYAVPDRAELHFGVRTEAASAEEAQETNSRNVDAVIKVLTDHGIKKENIQTTMYDVSPQYDWNTGDGTNIIAYSVNSNLSVKDVLIDDAGQLITACTKAGANQFNGISYSCTNYDALYADALKKAVTAAEAKAGTMAEAAGRTLGNVRSIAEGYQDMTYANNSEAVYAASGKGAAEDSAISANIVSGQAEITATVTVTYSLQ